MRAPARLALGWIVAAGLIGPAASAARGDADSPPRGVPEGLAARAWAITEAVLEHHIEPPTRQHVILSGIKALDRACGVPTPEGVARAASAVSDRERLAALLAETWARLPADATSTRREGLTAALEEGLLKPVPGFASLVSAGQVRARQQIEGNAYVGLHVTAGFNTEEKRVQIGQPIEGGPAQRAGVRPDDLIDEIDGVSTEGMDQEAILDRLRGAVGTVVTLRVRQPKSAETRTLQVTRGLLPRRTIEGLRNFADGSDDLLIKGEPIGYLKFLAIAGSAPHELRGMVRRLDRQGARALVLDLRSAGRADLHATVLLADSLLAGGPIGRLRTVRGVRAFEAEPDALLPDWPMAVLVDGQTKGPAEWLAAALQDNRRAVVVGLPTGWILTFRDALTLSDNADVRTAVPFGDGTRSIEMPTGRLERGDGRPLARPLPRTIPWGGGMPWPAHVPGRDPDDGPLMLSINPRIPADLASLRGMPGAGDGGVMPDLLAGSPPRAGFAPRPAEGPREEDPNVFGDPALTAALRHLRGRLGAP